MTGTIEFMQPPPASDHILDITAYVCPMTFVKARLLAERMQPGEVAEVVMRGEEPAENLPRSLAEMGCQVLHMTAEAEGVTRLWFTRSG